MIYQIGGLGIIIVYVFNALRPVNNQYTHIHIEILLIVHLFEHYNMFSVGGVTKCRLIKSQQLLFRYPSSFDFFILILSFGTNEILLPDGLKKS